jgi:undecaprenyl pyrophosphate synthase
MVYYIILIIISIIFLIYLIFFKNKKNIIKNKIHLGIIPDGNRRWHKKNNCNLKSIYYKMINESINSYKNYTNLEQINEISIYLLSKDNLEKRNDETLHMIEEVLENIIERLNELKDLKFNFIGERHLLPNKLRELCKLIEDETANNNIIINLAIAYDPISDSKKIIEGNRKNNPIDLVIRTGGEKRSSGFFPIGTLYSEWIYLDKLFPDITLNDIDSSIEEYYLRDRRYGA